jgi:4'-phosphopantetheinyl transferase EntD
VTASLGGVVSDLALGALLTRELGVPLMVLSAHTPASFDRLSPGEAATLASLTSAARREEWRLGRAALKAALAAIGEGDDTSCLALPHPRLSLTHSGSVALAVASTDACLGGLGVDLEIERTPKPAMARFFLDEAELGWLAAQPDTERAAHLARLWSIKEAVFKADLANASATLRDYHLTDPAAASGLATRHIDSTLTQFAYVTADFPAASLAVAVRRERILS